MEPRRRLLSFFFFFCAWALTAAAFAQVLIVVQASSCQIQISEGHVLAKGRVRVPDLEAYKVSHWFPF